MKHFCLKIEYNLSTTEPGSVRRTSGSKITKCNDAVLDAKIVSVKANTYEKPQSEALLSSLMTLKTVMAVYEMSESPT